MQFSYVGMGVGDFVSGWYEGRKGSACPSVTDISGTPDGGRTCCSLWGLSLSLSGLVWWVSPNHEIVSFCLLIMCVCVGGVCVFNIF